MSRERFHQLYVPSKGFPAATVYPPSLKKQTAITYSGVSGQRALTFDATGGFAIGTAIMSLALPPKTRIVRAWYEVLTSFASATNAAVLSIGVATDAPQAIVSPIAISNPNQPWNAGAHNTMCDGDKSNMTPLTTAQRAINITVTTEALTGGILMLFAEWQTVS